MYDRRLDAVIAAAELGSFAKAAARLHVSTTALAKQIDGFEAENELVLFERTHRGVVPTEAGRVLAERAPELMRLSDDILRVAHEQGGCDLVVRLGVSLICPARKTLEAWPEIHRKLPGVRLELVPIGDIYDPAAGVVERLGHGVDFIQTTYSAPRWGDACQVLPLGTAPLAVDVPRGDRRFADRVALAPEDLSGMRVHALRHMNDACDALIDRLEATSGVEVVEVATYDLDLFNHCAEDGEAIVTSGALSSLHPMLWTVPLAGVDPVECALLYPREPGPAATAFTEAYRDLLAE